MFFTSLRKATGASVNVGIIGKEVSSNVNKVLTLNNVNKSHHTQELPLFSTPCCISFVQLDIILICNTSEIFLH